jgi:hypothetical protein
MSLHLDALYWFRANQSLFLLINSVCLVEKYKKQLYIIIFDPTGARIHDLVSS